MTRMDDKMISSQSRWFSRGAFLIVVLTGVVGILCAKDVVAAYAGYPPDFDESVHLLPIWQLAHAWAQGDFVAFWQVTIQQDQLAGYPFFHSWLTFLAWYLFEDITTVRVMSLVYVVGASLFAFGIGYDLSRYQSWRWLAGFVSGLLVLASFPLWVYGSLAYLEGVGLLVTMAALWLYGRSWQLKPKRPNTATFYTVASSLAIAVAFFTKYNFGLFLLGGVGLNELVQAVIEKRLFGRRWLALGMPFLLISTIWFVLPGHLDRFLGFSAAQEGGYTINRVASWMYYPNSFSVHYLSNWGAVCFVLAGLVYGVWRWREPAVRSVLTYLLTGYFLLLVVPQKEPRFLYVVAPTVFVLAGALSAAGAHWLPRQQVKMRWLGYSLAVLFFLWQGTAVYQRFRFYQPALDMAIASGPETAAAYQFLSSHVLNNDQSLHMLNSWHLLSHNGLLWYHLTVPDSPGNSPPISNSLVHDITLDAQQKLMMRIRDQETAVLLSIDGSPAGDETGWAIVEPLLASGELVPLASSPSFTIEVWDEAFRDAVLAGDFASMEIGEEVMAQYRHNLNIRLHLYQIQE